MMLSRHYHELLGGESDDYQSETERRVYQFAEELRTKRTYDHFTTFRTYDDQMIIGNHLKLFSFCEHHLLPFYGEVAIGYIPNQRILGLSKFQRIVDKFASRPQVQERLTTDILKFIEEKLSPKGVGVIIKAIHTCVFARGPQSANAEFTTNSMSGIFKTQLNTRQEFLQSIDGNRVRL